MKIRMYHLLDLHFFKINDLFLNACLTPISWMLNCPNFWLKVNV